MTARLLLVGGGKMGRAMLEGWLQGSLTAQDVCVVDPSPEIAAELTSHLDVSCVADATDLPSNIKPETIVLAVKPQHMDAALPAYAPFALKGALYLSIAAGKTIEYFEGQFGSSAHIVRAMPNTPASVGRGITVACPNAQVTDGERTWADTLLSSVGEVAWVDDEALIDPVTALSGGGPAYVFLLAEIMAKAGIDAGLPRDLAERLARVTVAGAGELLHQSAEGPATLRQNVTSPGGTTAEALKVLMADDGWQPIMTAAIKAAAERSKELAG